MQFQLTWQSSVANRALVRDQELLWIVLPLRCRV